MFKSLKRRVALGAVAAVGAAGLVTIAAPAANAATNATAISVTGVGRIGGTSIKLTVASTATAADVLHAVATAVPAAQTQAISVDTVTASAVVSGASYLGTLTATPASGVLAAGVYTFLVWSDTNTAAEAAPPAASVATTVSVTLGGAPASATLTEAAGSAATIASDTATAKAVSLTLKDAAGVATLLLNNESVTATPSAGSVGSSTTNGSTTSATIGGPAATTTGSLKFYVGNTTAGTTTISFAGSGLLYGAFTSQTYTLTSFAAVDATSIKTSETAFTNNTGAASTATSSTDLSSATIYLSTTDSSALAFTFTVAGTASSTIITSVSANGTKTLPAGVTAATTNVTTSSLGTVAVTVTATSAVAGQGYTFTAGTKSVNVVFETPVGVTVAVTPAGPLTAVIGGKVSLTASVTDQFANPLSGALVTWSYSATGRGGAANAVLSTSTTGSAGTSVLDYTDLGTTTTGTDSIQAKASFVGSAANPGSTPVVISYSTSITPATVTVGFAAADNDTTTANGFSTTAVGQAVGNQETYTATLKTASGALLGSGIAVTFTFDGASVAGAATKTVYTTSGVATVVTRIMKKGTVKVTATASGISGSDSSVTGTVASTKGRIVSLDAASYTVAAGGLKRISATVKDAYGNIVPLAAVKFTIASGAGRFAGGALSYDAVADATGVAIADLAPASGESGAGSVKVALTSPDATDELVTTTLADGVTAYPKAVTSATSTVSVTAASAATATTDAATTSKINDIATAVANLSTTVAGLVASLVAQIKDTKAAIADTKAALDKLAAVVAKIQKKVKA